MELLIGELFGFWELGILRNLVNIVNYIETLTLKLSVTVLLVFCETSFKMFLTKKSDGIKSVL